MKRENGVTSNFSPSPVASGKTVTLQRVTDTFYKDNTEPALEPIPATIGSQESGYHNEIHDPSLLSPKQEPRAIVDSEASQCTICMDEPADTVMRPCNHGGIGYKCADALVRRSLLTGGALCPHCRTQITSLIKLDDMNDQVAKGIEVEVPRAYVVRRKRQ